MYKWFKIVEQGSEFTLYGRRPWRPFYEYIAKGGKDWVHSKMEYLAKKPRPRATYYDGDGDLWWDY